MNRRTFFGMLSGLIASIPFLGKSEGNIPTGIYLEKASEGECVSFTLQKEVTGMPTYGNAPIVVEIDEIPPEIECYETHPLYGDTGYISLDGVNWYSSDFYQKKRLIKNKKLLKMLR